MRFWFFFVCSFIAFITQAQASLYTFDCPSRGQFIVDSDAKLFEWDKFGVLKNVKFEVDGTFIRTTTPVGGWFLTLNHKTGEISRQKGDTQGLFDKCLVRVVQTEAQDAKKTQNSGVQFGSETNKKAVGELWGKVKFTLDCRGSQNGLIKIDSVSNLVEWSGIKIPLTESRGSKLENLYELDGNILRLSTPSFPLAFDLSNGNFFELKPDYTAATQGTKKDILVASCSVSAEESKLDDKTRIQTLLANAFNSLETHQIVALKRLFRINKNLSFGADPNRPTAINIADREDEFSIMMMRNLIAYQSLHPIDGFINGAVSSENNAKMFLLGLVDQYRSIEEQRGQTASLNAKKSPNIDADQFKQMCSGIILGISKAIESQLQLPTGYTVQTDGIQRLWINVGINPFYTAKDKDMSPSELSVQPEVVNKICDNEYNRIKKWVGRRLSIVAGQSETNIMIVPTDEQEKRNIPITWATGQLRPPEVVIGQNGRQQRYQHSGGAAGEQAVNLAQIPTPFIVFTHTRDDYTNSTVCSVRFQIFSETSNVSGKGSYGNTYYAGSVYKDLLDRGKRSEYARAFSFSYWGIPLSWIGPKKGSGVFLESVERVSSSLYDVIDSNYSAFDGGLNWNGVEKFINAGRYQNRGKYLRRVDFGDIIERATDTLINSKECNDALNSERERYARAAQ